MVPLLLLRAYNIRHQLNYPLLEQSAIEEFFDK